MPEQYIISGIINLANGADRAGIRVQAFDRDLPSLERRSGLAPQLLGEATTNVDGSFQITYTLEQFSSGDAISLFRRARTQNADISFLVFDRTGQPLNIRGIEAGNRSYRTDQIIFNAPTPLDVSIFVDAPQEAGTSEYERLTALIAPVVEDLPLTELSDEDIFFLINELGLEQQRDDQQHIEWLRRCALLAQESGLPVEAFYGWGRKDQPTTFAELAAVPLKDVPTVLTKLTDLPDEVLSRALLAAVAETIIPASFRTQVDAIITQLKRRNQVQRTVTAQLVDDTTNTALIGYTVTTVDQDNNNENLGLDITDRTGQFSFSYFVPLDAPRDVPPRHFSFQVVTPEAEIIPDNAQASIDARWQVGTIVPVKVSVPARQTPALDALLQQVQLQLPSELTVWLRSKNINTFADIRRNGGLRDVADLPATDPRILHTLAALTDLDRVSSAVQVNKTLLDKGYDSVLAIADTPYSEFVSAVSDDQTALTVLESAKLHVIATIQTNMLHTILTGMAADTANGFALPNAME